MKLQNPRTHLQKKSPICHGMVNESDREKNKELRKEKGKVVPDAKAAVAAARADLKAERARARAR